MDLNAVHMLVKVAECKSFTQAAHSLGTTQSRISRTIAQLEAELGTRLLHRNTRNVSLTPDGCTLVDRSAELIALWALRLKGWRLLARRYKTPAGEVDLIMRRGEVTAFIEVKARRSLDGAVESVTPRQARRIAAAARQFMAEDRRAALQACRFDIVAVTPYHWPTHIENAFEGAD